MASWAKKSIKSRTYISFFTPEHLKKSFKMKDLKYGMKVLCEIEAGA